MKLRNKKTGEIRRAESREDGIYLCNELAGSWFCYDLETLASSWEYYVEPAEPLIKDEKIRKAVRAWAEANNITEVEYDKVGGTLVALHKPAKIKFNDSLDLNANEWSILAIAELCGEEEA